MSKKEIPTPEKGMRNNEKEEEGVHHHQGLGLLACSGSECFMKLMNLSDSR
jgi:hypothetical protein